MRMSRSATWFYIPFTIVTAAAARYTEESFRLILASRCIHYLWLWTNVRIRTVDGCTLSHSDRIDQIRLGLQDSSFVLLYRCDERVPIMLESLTISLASCRLLTEQLVAQTMMVMIL